MFSKHALATLVVLSSALSLAPLAAAQQTGNAPAGTSAAAPAPAKYKSPKLSRAQLDALFAQPEQVLVLDVRRPDELTNIGGFPAYLSIQSKELEKYLGFIPKERQIVTVSNHAGRALAAADLLAGKGYKVAGAIGAQDYEAEGGTLSKIAPPPPKPAAATAASK